MILKGVEAIRFVSLILSCQLSEADGQQLTDGQVDVVSARLAESALLPWELGTRAQTILELNATTYSVFNTSVDLPPPVRIPSSISTAGSLVPFFAIAKEVVTNRTLSNNNTVGPQPLVNDSSAADPASIGVSVLLANLTGQDSGEVDYAGAATDQLNYLFTDVPKTSDGAISHRVAQLQLWSDFVYMVPPFLATYGVMTNNITLLEASYNQIKLYRSYLRDSQTGMWRHVVLGDDSLDTPNDPGFWCTGNGWAAAGMLRVLMTLRQSEFANTFTNEQSDLSSWVSEIHTAIYPHLDSSNIFTNYADQSPTANGSFYDAACTALLASTVYRAATLLNQNTYIPKAEASRATLFSTNATAPTSNATTTLAGYQHITSDGWLTPVVNPHSYNLQGSESPEAQAFVIQLYAAHRDWVLATSKTSTSPPSLKHLGGKNMWAIAVGLVCFYSRWT
ncbi:hypothetical protein HYPSUDRAFT_147994 [Hypholoma sublateritium FD-334 SS-4]|uniref:Glycoside hydrolase family 105 protein n=1 Tax=Hypholoma sublateritium (strain FD-334 SS-4) TaxID=945553 RepID=A0A0D2NAR9_HYPSF|nr:hypothetical protein HYPSUDRAFT_147994 [Hypholoma sublateritium FD-334 SS-4]